METYRRLNGGKDAKVYSVHAGLECGLFKLGALKWRQHTAAAPMESSTISQRASERACAKAILPLTLLRCRLLSVCAAYPDLDCVSIGPTIHHAHSPQECLLIDTVAPFYEWLKQSIVAISKGSIDSK